MAYQLELTYGEGGVVRDVYTVRDAGTIIAQGEIGLGDIVDSIHRVGWVVVRGHDGFDRSDDRCWKATVVPSWPVQS